MGSLNTRDIEEAKRTLRSHYSKNYQINSYPEEWRNLSELPSKEEIMPKTEAQLLSEAAPRHSAPEAWDEYQRDPVYDPKLPINVIDGPWESNMTYVGSHYQPLREDAVAALRRSVGEIQAKPDMFDDQDTCIYSHVTFIGLQLCRIGAAFRVAFSIERAGKQIRWQQSKRLLQGTLVALSPHRDKFRSICKLAVIAARPIEGGLDQNPPTVDFFWADPNEAVFDPVEQYMMVEAREGYYEASRHMLVALQKLMTEKSDLMKHVAFLDREIGPPRYLRKQPFMDLTALVRKPEAEPAASVDEETERLFNVDVLDKFPQNLRSTMDDSQMRACRDMLTKSVAIVQGPPGTGKTFTSVSALKVMIENLGPGDPPIIISAQTNHALDQLLNHVMAFDERIVRLGGRADKENKNILERTLYELRVANPDVPNGKVGHFRCLKDFRDNVEFIRVALGPVLRDEIITAEALLANNLISEEQRASLFDAEAEWAEDGEVSSGLIVDWVGDNLEVIPSAPQVNLGLPMKEEEDIAYEQAQSLAMELDGNGNRDGDSPSQDTESLEALRGVWVPFRRKFTGKHTGPVVDAKVRNLLKSNANLYDIDKRHRGEVYRYWEKQLNNFTLRELRARLIVYQKMVEDYQVTRGISNFRMVHHLGIKVVGCTTTGLAKYRGFISALGPRTLLIEEAAETLEGTIMAGLVESLEQLILVGDHQQLQAQCTVRALEDAPYHLNVSMFERLIDNGLPYVMLNKQRRMIPDIRKLLCIEPDPFYKDLQDHDLVLDRVHARPPVPGMGGRDTYFFHHSWPEARSSDCSRFNPDEAEMMAGVFHYLVFNGVDPAKITVLTFYNGQRRHLIKELNKRKDLYPERPYFKVFTVDSYQGEENDIILLSLVRSNSYLSVGFLDNKNRLVVALSRAHRGLYIFGNTITLTMAETTEDKYGREPLWDPLIHFMKAQGRYSLEGGFPITCRKHGNTVRIIDPISWFINTGGCEMPCGDGHLPCGHPCTLTCHPFEHSRVICKEPCGRILPCGHGCANHCNAKPCYCTLCAMPVVADGRQVFDPSTAFTSEDLGTNRVLYEEDDENKVASPQNEIPGRNKWNGRHHHQVAFSEAAAREGSRSGKKGGRSSGKRSSHSNASQRPPRGGIRYLDDSISNATRHIHRVGDNSLRTSMGSNRISPLENALSGPSLGNSFYGNSQQTNPIIPVSRGSRSGSGKPPHTSNPQAWRSWDAKRADEEMEERRRLEDELVPAVDRSKLIINETYLPVTVENGLRHLNSSGAKNSVIHRAPSVMSSTTIPQPARRLVLDVTPPVEGLKKTALESKAQDLIDFGEEPTALSRFPTNLSLVEADPVLAIARIQGLGNSLKGDPDVTGSQDLLGDSLLDRDDGFFVSDQKFSDLLDLDERIECPADDEREEESVKTKKQTKPKQQHHDVAPVLITRDLPDPFGDAGIETSNTKSTLVMNTSELAGSNRHLSGSQNGSIQRTKSSEQQFGGDLLHMLSIDEFPGDRDEGDEDPKGQTKAP